jgi:hypothetical protein
VAIDGVFFPLLATIIPKWLQAVRAGEAGELPRDTGSQGQSLKVVFLVSGVGIPRDSRQPHWGNSTEGA